MIDGGIVDEVNGQPYSLSTGDALSFPGDEAHSYLNPNSQPARFSLAVFDQGVAAAHRTDTDID